MSRPVRQSRAQPGSRRAVEFAVNMRPFEKLIGGDHLLEISRRDEEILAAIHFAVSWRASGERNRIAKIRHLIQHALDQRALAAARRRTDDEENAAPFGRLPASSCLQAAFVYFTRHSGPVREAFLLPP